MSSHNNQGDFTEDSIQDELQKLMLEKHEIIHPKNILQGASWESRYYSEESKRCEIRYINVATSMPPQCKEFDEAFNRSSDLTKNQKINNGQKPYKCKDYSKFFACYS
jgi:uncharacterized Zn-finger protein